MAHRNSNDLEQVNMYGKSNSTRKVATTFNVYAKVGTKPAMEKKVFNYQGSTIYAIKIRLNSNTQLGTTYFGYPDWVCSLHNDWMLDNGYYEIAAINAGYFEMATGKPIGAVMLDWSGKWSQFKGADCVPSKNNGYPTLSYDGSTMSVLNAYANEIDLSKYAWLQGVGRQLVKNHQIDLSLGTTQYGKVCASAIGFDNSTKDLWLVANVGGTLNSQQRAEVMRDLGCELAFQLDGGGSTQIQWLAIALGGSVSAPVTQPKISNTAKLDAAEVQIKEIEAELTAIKAKIQALKGSL